MTAAKPSSFVTNVVNGVPHLAVVVSFDRDWQAEHRLVVQAGRVVVAETRVYPRRWEEEPTQSEEQAGVAADVPGRGLTTRLLRRVTVGAPIDHYVEMFQSLRESARSGASGVRVDIERGTREEFNISEKDFLSSSPALRALLNLEWRPRKPAPSSVARVPGRRPLSDDVLVEAAAAYIAARKRGSARPVPDAAKALKMTEARMRDLIYRARQRGILTPTLQGRGGGELTPEAMLQLARLKRRSGGRKRR
jgi:hypothetical protein